MREVRVQLDGRVGGLGGDGLHRGVDGLVNTLAATVGGSSGRLRRVQNGFVRSYALSMFVGAVLLVGAFLLVRI